MRLVLRTLLVLLVLASAVCAQSMMGTLSGNVTDSSGAAMAGVNVTLINEKSGDVRKTLTNSVGFYSIPALPAGAYKAVFEFEGFKKAEVPGIEFNGGDKRDLPVIMEIGSSSQQIEVTATNAQLATVDSGEKASLVTSNQLQNLAIVGRNAAEFVKIMPGSTMSPNMGVNRPNYSGENYGINGAGIGGSQGGLGDARVNGQQVDITQDGAHTYDPGAPGVATPVNPNADMVQEIKVLTSNFAAEHSKGPVVMNTVSKSGGNAFHGEGYLYARHNSLNANDWENNYTGQPKPASDYYFPGGNLGGPVLIPGTGFNKNRDKLFFFQGFEYYKQKLDSGVMRAFVPTEDMRRGDFSRANTYRVRTGNLGNIPNFEGGIVPANMIDPGGRALLNLYPMPNADPLANNGYNYINALTVDQNSWQSLSRVDYSVSDYTKLFVRYNAQREKQNQPTGLWGGRAGDNTVPSPTNILGKNASDSIATSLTHVFSPTMTSETTFGYTAIDFPNEPDDPTKLTREAAGYPYRGVFKNATTTIPAVLSWGGDIPNLFGAGHHYDPSMDAVKGVWSIGENFAKITGTHTLKFGAYFESDMNRQHDWSQANGTLQFNAWGSPSGNSYADMLTGRGFTNYDEQTLNAKTDIRQKVMDFYAQDSWKVTPRLTLEYGMRFQHMGRPYDGPRNGLAIFDAARYNNDPAAMSQRTGLVYHSIDSSIPVSGAESRFLFYSPRLGVAWDVFGTGKTVLRGGWGKFRAFDGMQSGNTTGPVSTARGGASYSCNGNCTSLAELENMTVASGGLAGFDVYDPNDNEHPLTTSYSFTISQVLPRNFVFETAYVGNVSKYGFQNVDINVAPLFSMLNNPGRTEDSLRPRTNYQNIDESKHITRSDYNSWQTSITRNAGLFTISGNYTWSKLTGVRNMASALPDWGQRWEHGLLNQHRAHAFNVAYTVEAPAISAGNRFVRGAINGWQISGITQWSSGPHLQSQNTSFSTPGSNTALLGTGGVGLYAHMICDPREGLAPGQYVNGACFGAPQRGMLGDAALPYLPGPAFFNSDISVFKRFTVTESQRLEFRVSAFNFLNHPLRSFRSSDDNLKLRFDAQGNQSNERFGFADYKYGHRVMQLAVKYMF